jgi:hypothetical protein
LRAKTASRAPRVERSRLVTSSSDEETTQGLKRTYLDRNKAEVKARSKAKKQRGILGAVNLSGIPVASGEVDGIGALCTSDEVDFAATDDN